MPESINIELLAESIPCLAIASTLGGAFVVAQVTMDGSRMVVETVGSGAHEHYDQAFEEAMVIAVTGRR